MVDNSVNLSNIQKLNQDKIISYVSDLEEALRTGDRSGINEGALAQHFYGFDIGRDGRLNNTELTNIKDHLNNLASDEMINKIVDADSGMTTNTGRVSIDGHGHVTGGDANSFNYILQQKHDMTMDETFINTGKAGGGGRDNAINGRQSQIHGDQLTTTGGYHIFTESGHTDALVITDSSGKKLTHINRGTVTEMEGAWHTKDSDNRFQTRGDSTYILDDGTKILFNRREADFHHNSRDVGVYIITGDEVYMAGMSLDEQTDVGSDIVKLDISATEFDAEVADNRGSKYFSGTFVYTGEANNGQGGWAALTDDGSFRDVRNDNGGFTQNSTSVDLSSDINNNQRAAALDGGEVLAFDEFKQLNPNESQIDQFLDYRFENNASVEMLDLYVKLMSEADTDALDILDHYMKNGVSDELNSPIELTGQQIASYVELKARGMDDQAEAYANLTEVITNSNDVEFNRSNIDGMPKAGARLNYLAHTFKYNHAEGSDSSTLNLQGNKQVTMNLGYDYEVTEDTKLVFDVVRVSGNREEGGSNEFAIGLIDTTKPDIEYHNKHARTMGEYTAKESNYRLFGDLTHGEIGTGRYHYERVHGAHVNDDYNLPELGWDNTQRVEINIGEDFDGDLSRIAFFGNGNGVTISNMQLINTNQSSMDYFTEHTIGEDATFYGRDHEGGIFGELVLDRELAIAEEYVKAVEEGFNFEGLEANEIGNYLEFIVGKEPAKANAYLDLVMTDKVSDNDRDRMSELYMEKAFGDNAVLNNSESEFLVELFKENSFEYGREYVEQLEAGVDFEGFSEDEIKQFLHYHLCEEEVEAALYHELVNMRNTEDISQEKLDLFVANTDGEDSLLATESAEKLGDLIKGFDDIEVAEQFVSYVENNQSSIANTYYDLVNSQGMTNYQAKVDYFTEVTTREEDRLNSNQAEELKNYLVEYDELAVGQFYVELVEYGLEFDDLSDDEEDILMAYAIDGEIEESRAYLNLITEDVEVNGLNLFRAYTQGTNSLLNNDEAKILANLILNDDENNVDSNGKANAYISLMEAKASGNPLITDEAIALFINNVNNDNSVFNANEANILVNYLQEFDISFSELLVDLVENDVDQDGLDIFDQYTQTREQMGRISIDQETNFVQFLIEEKNGLAEMYLGLIDSANNDVDEAGALISLNASKLELFEKATLTGDNPLNLRQAGTMLSFADSDTIIAEAYIDLIQGGANSVQEGAFEDYIDQVDGLTTANSLNQFVNILGDAVNLNIGQAGTLVNYFIDNPENAELYVDLVNANAYGEALDTFDSYVNSGIKLPQNVKDDLIDFLTKESQNPAAGISDEFKNQLDILDSILGAGNKELAKDGLQILSGDNPNISLTGKLRNSFNVLNFAVDRYTDGENMEPLIELLEYQNNITNQGNSFKRKNSQLINDLKDYKRPETIETQDNDNNSKDKINVVSSVLRNSSDTNLRKLAMYVDSRYKSMQQGRANEESNDFIDKLLEIDSFSLDSVSDVTKLFSASYELLSNMESKGINIDKNLKDYLEASLQNNNFDFSTITTINSPQRVSNKGFNTKPITSQLLNSDNDYIKMMAMFIESQKRAIENNYMNPEQAQASNDLLDTVSSMNPSSINDSEQMRNLYELSFNIIDLSKQNGSRVNESFYNWLQENK